MLRTKATHRDSLHTSCPTVVTQRNTRQAMKGIRDIRYTHCQHILTIHQMQGCRTRDSMLPLYLRNRHTFQLMQTVSNGICLCHRNRRYHHPS